MKKYALIFSLVAVAGISGCGNSHSDIGLVDVARLTSNWPKFVNDNNQLVADQRAIAASHASPAQKQREALALQRKYAGLQDELVKEVRDAATKIAQEKNMRFVVAREAVGYGGEDITPDVEREMGITEKATPTP